MTTDSFIESRGVNQESRSRARMLAFWLLVALAVTLLAWQPLELQPTFGLDPSWQAGQEMAIHNGITFGHHLVFTYGPLGFLSITRLYYLHLGELSFAYTALIRFALAAALLFALRRTFGGLAAFLIALVVASVAIALGELAIVLIVAVTALVDGIEGRPAVLIAGGVGAFAGLELLNKASTGVALAAIAGVLALCLPGRRRHYAAAALAGGVLTVLVGWAATGQSFAALPDYLSNSERIIAGYAAAMGYTDPTLSWQYTGALIALGLGLWGAWQATELGSERQRWGAAGLWLALWFCSFKEGFVLHDSIHAVRFFSPLLAGFAAFRWRTRGHTAALIGLGTLTVFTLAAESASLTARLDPTRNVSAAFNELRTVATPSRRAAVLAQGRASIISSEPLDSISLGLLRAHTVAAFPWEIAVIWAYGLHWDPLPVEQSYSAYTSGLDRLDAHFLESSRAPERILLAPSADIETRILGFDQGETTRELLCRYHALYATADFAVAGLGPDRCGAPRLLQTVHADWGQAVAVPPAAGADSLVFVRIGGVGVGGLEFVRSLLWRPSPRYVYLDGGAPHRLVPGTAADGLPLSAPAGADFPAPFNLVPGATTIAVTSGSQTHGGGEPVTYSFYSEPIARPATTG
jgi:hypothetical protein